jgi:hypothetical protein
MEQKFDRIAPGIYRHTYEYPLVIVTFLLLLWPAWCFGVEDNGNTLLATCGAAQQALDAPESAATLGAGFCFGLVHGLVGMNQIYEFKLKNAAFFCVPAGITNEQSVRIVLKYLRDHPEELHERSTVLAFRALQAAFPCTKK